MVFDNADSEIADKNNQSRNSREAATENTTQSTERAASWSRYDATAFGIFYFHQVIQHI
jgi:hypothetical protein